MVLGHGAITLQLVVGISIQDSQDVIATDPDLVGIAVRHGNHVFRGNADQSADIATEITDITPASDMQTIGALIPAILVHEGLIDTDV
jgi:hypothetical protein